MSAAVLLVALALSGMARAARIEQGALLETFRSICLTPAAEAGTLAAPAAAAGFKPTTVKPTGFEWKELAAWERGGIRLFRMTDPRESVPIPMCGVSASLASSTTDDELVEIVQTMAHGSFAEGHSGWGVSNWTVARRGGAVGIEIDRSSAPDVRVRLIAWPQRS
jgi:hypothetical protein